MQYNDLKKALESVNPDIKMIFDESCHIQYTIHVNPKLKPVCQCYCDKVIVDGKYMSIDPYMIEITWDEVKKYVDQII